MPVKLSSKELPERVALGKQRYMSALHIGFVIHSTGSKCSLIIEFSTGHVQANKLVFSAYGSFHNLFSERCLPSVCTESRQLVN